MVYPLRFSNLTRLGCGLAGSESSQHLLALCQNLHIKAVSGSGLAQSHPMFAVRNGCHIGGTSHQEPAKARLIEPLFALLGEPDFCDPPPACPLRTRQGPLYEPCDDVDPIPDYENVLTD